MDRSKIDAPGARTNLSGLELSKFPACHLISWYLGKFSRKIRFLSKLFKRFIEQIRKNPILSINRDKIGVRAEKKAVSMVFGSRPYVFP